MGSQNKTKSSTHFTIGLTVDTVKLKDGKAGIGNCSLDTARGSKSIYCNMLNVDLVTPHDRKVAFVFWEYRRILVCFCYVQQCCFSPFGTGSNLEIDW